MPDAVITCISAIEHCNAALAAQRVSPSATYGQAVSAPLPGRDNTIRAWFGPTTQRIFVITPDDLTTPESNAVV